MISKNIIKLTVAVVICVAIASANAATYYVAPNGNDGNPGSIGSPFATLKKGHDVAEAGDTVYLRGGTYKCRSDGLSKSGKSNTQRICFWAYPGEKPYFDCSGGGWAIGMTGSWLHVKGIEIFQGGVTISNAHDNILELMNCHHSMGVGISILHGTGGHLILNCDAHDHFDAVSKDTPGENADGFGIHYQESGAPDTIRGCRSWWNSDDGYDFINHEVPVTIENSWAMGAGYIHYATGQAGNGNGFKIGSSKNGIRHTVRNCIAWKNKASGFYANHSSGGNTWYNNTSFQNGTQFNMLASTWAQPGGKGARTDGVTLTGDKRHIMRNNIGYPEKNSYITGYGVDTKSNAWDLGITPSAKDFLSITDPSLTTTGRALEEVSPMFGPRKADGSLPDVDFLKLASGSALIDKGENVGLSFKGSAPDLGAHEFGTVTGVFERMGSRYDEKAEPGKFTAPFGNWNSRDLTHRGLGTGLAIYSISGKKQPSSANFLPSAGVYIGKPVLIHK